MGVQGSKIALKLKRDKLTHKTISELESSTHFSADEIKLLYSRFKDLVKVHKRKPGIKIHDFQDVFGISSLQLAEYIFSAFDANGDGIIDFKEFVHGFSSLCDRASQEERLKLAFHLFDLDKDGIVKISELQEIMLLIAKEKLTYLPDDQIEVLVTSACQKFDPDKTGSIDFKQFESHVSEYTFMTNFAGVDLKAYFANVNKN
ncbi:EF hand family protein [Histomonas meleagridis]|uniref:EF hand family protein n=1 Tax=Histomonas meleagridis TaxID=135588 RepID=UPI00355A4CF9|nr:EF hand family protein [Histomonas meleagridis]KAH0805319.1 EF hand family protein [Histomonas meleagridis]